MPADKHELTEKERDNIYTQEIYQEYFKSPTAASSPSFHLLAGQPGAGKTALQEHIERNLAEPPSVVLNIDDLREYHPHLRKLLASSDLSTVIAAPKLVSEDSLYWFRRLLNDALSLPSSIILDTPLGGATAGETFSKNIENIHEHGYSLHFNVLAVSKEVSTLGVYLRFLRQIKDKGIGRMVSIKDTHDLYYKNLIPNITYLLSTPQAQYFNSISVFKKSVFEQSGVIVNNMVEPIFSTENTGA
ncbi:MAG: hypothetical protein CRN43_08330, partial [Candidatus Nephrothrix sp. EaCA]